MAGEENKTTGRLLFPHEVAARLKVSRSWVTQHAKGLRNPQLPGFKMGGVWRFQESDIDQFIRDLRDKHFTDAA